MTYKEKCLRIEAIMQDDNVDEEELYNLLIDVVKSNALKKRMFNDNDYYDDFSKFMAAGLYMRVIRKDISPIKSISNYINTTLKGFFDEFAKIEFRQVIDTNLMENGIEIQYGLEELVKSQAVAQYTAFNEMYVDEYTMNIHKQIKKYVYEGNYALSATQLRFVYMSVMLTLITRKTRMYRLDERSTLLFPLILTDVKSRLGKDIQETLKSDFFLPDDLNIILNSEEGNDDD